MGGVEDVRLPARGEGQMGGVEENVMSAGARDSRVEPNRLFQLPCFVPELAGFRRHAVQTRGLKNDDLNRLVVGRRGGGECDGGCGGRGRAGNPSPTHHTRNNISTKQLPLVTT